MHLDILAISCDSFNEETNKQIGRGMCFVYFLFLIHWFFLKCIILFPTILFIYSYFLFGLQFTSAQRKLKLYYFMMVQLLHIFL